jgi:hypothetical protein
MDPMTLFALANGAVSAVKAGCKLYRDIKGAAGEVKDVLKDLDDQFHKLHPPDKPASPEAKRQFLEEKERIKELNKKANEGGTTNIYAEIGEELGKYYDNYYKCLAIFNEEEKRAHTEVYTGDASIGKRALQRILMRKQLEEMGKELRELMVYQSPPELGALYTEVSDMMKVMGAEQEVLIAKQMKAEDAIRRKRRQRMDRLHVDIALGIAAITLSASVGLMISLVVQDRIEKYPHLGTDWIPKTEEQRRKDAEPKIWTGR